MESMYGSNNLLATQNPRNLSKGSQFFICYSSYIKILFKYTKILAGKLYIMGETP